MKSDFSLVGIFLIYLSRNRDLGNRCSSRKNSQTHCIPIDLITENWAMLVWKCCARVCVCVCGYACAQSCPTLCSSVDCSLPGSSVQGISQARILEQVAISSSGGSSWPRDRTHVSYFGRQILYQWAIWEVLKSAYPSSIVLNINEQSPIYLINICSNINRHFISSTEK